MANRNTRKRKALERKRELEMAVAEAMALEAQTVAEKAARAERMAEYPIATVWSQRSVTVMREGRVYRQGGTLKFRPKPIEPLIDVGIRRYERDGQLVLGERRKHYVR